MRKRDRPTILISADGIRLSTIITDSARAVSRGTVVQVHGITSEMNGGGIFRRLSGRLSEEGFTALRFSFRGHGTSGGSQRTTTVSGQVLDLRAVVEFAIRSQPSPLSIVAASFGAVPLLLALPHIGDKLAVIVFWNPVLDLRRTILEPELPWGRRNFGPAQLRILAERGYLVVDQRFELGQTFFDELDAYQVGSIFLESTLPTLVIQAEWDEYVTHEITQKLAAARPSCDFHTVRRAYHGFRLPAHSKQTIEFTVDWIARRGFT